MSAVAYWASQIGMLLLIGLLTVAIFWEADHLVDWAKTLWEAHGDGSAASYLRHHAYTYVTWFFGTDFGWTLED